MSSPALRHKIAKARLIAPLELNKARLCAEVILASIQGEAAMECAVLQLKQGLGNNWTPVTAMQFMSGRRGEFASDCGEPNERAQMYLAHLVAKHICSAEGLGAVSPPSDIDVAKLHELIAAFRKQLQ